MPQPHKRPADWLIAQRLAEVRKARGISQAELAKAIGVSVGLIQAYEHGRSRIPVSRFEAIARILVSEPGDRFEAMAHMFGLEPSKKPPHPKLERVKPKLIVPSNLGFYSRRIDSPNITADAHINIACGLPPDAPSHLAWERWHDRIHADDRAPIDAAIAHLLDPKDGTFAMQYRLVGHDGIERCIVDLATAIFEKDQPARYQGAMLDITREARTTTAENRRNAFVAAIKEYLKGTAALLFALLYGGNHGRRVKADGLGQVDQLDHIEAPIAALETGNPGLGPLQLLGELNLSDIGALALGHHQLDQPFMTLAVNGLHLF